LDEIKEFMQSRGEDTLPLEDTEWTLDPAYLTIWVPGGFPTAISTGTGRFTFKACKNHCFDRALQHYYSPADFARELFKPSTDSASLVVQIEKKFFVLHVGFSLGDVILGTCFCPCGQIYLALGTNSTSHCWNLGCHPNL